MNIITSFWAYVGTLITMGIIDSVWLFSTGAFYRKTLGHLFATNFNFFPAVIFYLIYALGVVFFVISPAIKSGQSLLMVFLSGALLGLVAYATYDLTNNATMRDWPVLITLIDMAWGAFLTGIVSTIVVAVINYFK